MKNYLDFIYNDEIYTHDMETAVDGTSTRHLLLYRKGLKSMERKQDKAEELSMSQLMHEMSNVFDPTPSKVF